MVRPIKLRKISFNPNVIYFKPRGAPLSRLEEIDLSLDELEAIRLYDMEGLEQGEAATKMNVSQSTFSRILNSARKKIAKALVEGKAIKIHKN